MPPAATGLDLWKRNLQLLVPFLIEPRIELLSMSHLGKNSQGAEQVKVCCFIDRNATAMPYTSPLGYMEYPLAAMVPKLSTASCCRVLRAVHRLLTAVEAHLS